MNPRADSTSVISSLPTRDILRAFPFYFAWYENDVILEVGPSLPKICPQAVVGARLQDVVTSMRPEGHFSHALAAEHHERLFLLQDRLNHRVLRGQVILLESPSRGIMLASPWFTEPDDVDACGLTMSDFAIHDQTMDLLQVLQTQRMAADGIRHLKKTVPSWLDVAPESAFLLKLYTTPLPKGTTHDLIYGSIEAGPFYLKGENEGVVTVASETEPRITRNATSLKHLPHGHVEILNQLTTAASLQRVLNR